MSIHRHNVQKPRENFLEAPVRKQKLPKWWGKKKWDNLQWTGSYPGKETILLDA